MAKDRKKAKSKVPVSATEVLEASPIGAMIEQAKSPTPEPADDAVAAFEKQRAKGQAVTDPADIMNEARRRKAEIEPERPMPVPLGDTNVVDMPQRAEIAGKHTAAVLARRPNLAPAPAGFYPVLSDRRAGVRVSKSYDNKVSAIQFSEDRLPTREEKDFLERVGHPPDGQNFIYKSERRQWERETPPGWTPGENTIDATRVMTELAMVRNEGLAR